MTRMTYTGIADATLPGAVPVERYDLRIVSAVFNEKSKRSGKPNIEAEIEILSHPEAASFRHYLTFPDGEDAKSDNFKRALTNAFLTAFNIEYDDTGFDDNDFPGCTADNMPLTLDKGDDGVERNSIDIFLVAQGLGLVKS